MVGYHRPYSIFVKTLGMLYDMILINYKSIITMILETLTRKYNKIQKLQNYDYKRYFHRTVDFNDKMVGILGHRGVGKTTFILQYLKSLDLAHNKKLYFSADSIILSNLSIYDIADEFSRNGGKVLVIDEIHKYKNFEHELKEIYDFLDDSSALQLEHKKADLSRRAVLYRIHGLSFREFLELKLEKQFNYFSLEETVNTVIESDLPKIRVLNSYKELKMDM
jgi:predicted AAA+ superfamily ATPase